MDKKTLRPVQVTLKGKEIKGFFHRYVYKFSNQQSDTHVLIEHEDGKLRYYDPFFVKFTDRVEKEKEQFPLDEGFPSSFPQ